MKKQRKQKIGLGIALLLVPVLIYGLFFIYPIVYTGYLSLMKWNGIATVKKTFVGLNNFKVLFSQKVFWHSLWNSVVFMIVSLGVIFPISFLLALLVSRKTKINGFLRTA